MKFIKTVLLLAVVLNLNTSFALEEPNETIMSAEEQFKALEEIAKELRRNMWINGYEEVSSHVEFVKKDFLDEYVKDQDYDTNLDSQEISKLYKCYYGKSCELYYIGVSSEMYGGYGSEGYFILFYPKSGKHFKISHVVYAE